MGKKRTHAETKDGFTKPSPDKGRVNAKHDKKDKRKNGETIQQRSAPVCCCATKFLMVANAVAVVQAPAGMAYG